MKLIKALGDISTDISLNAAEKMQRLLALGCEAMELPIGIISHIENDTYTVIAAQTPDGGINPGDTFNLGDTFCNDTLKAKGIVAYHNAARQPGLEHPCCQSFNLFTYIGIPIRIHNVPYGTLNFSSPETKDEPFSELHFDYLTLLAEWISMMISCKETFDQLMHHQNKLEQQNALFTHICQMASVGAWEHVVETGEIRWSSTMKRMHGLSEDAVVTAELASSFPAYATDLQNMVNLNRGSIEHGIPWSNQYEVELGNGERRWFKTYAKPVMENGRCVRIIGSTQDVTASVENENVLRQRREEAESALKVRTKFIANISHELRTPIHGVMGMLDALGRTPLTTKQTEFTEIAQQSAAHLLSQVNDVLDFSKIDAGLMTFETLEVDLNALIEHQTKLLWHELNRKGLTLLLDLNTTAGLRVQGDPVRIGQVVTNLLSNALKFTAEGQISVTTRALKQSDEQFLIQLVVCDTGVGIAQEHLTKILTAFEQGDGSMTRKYGGTGLGLAIVSQIADHYGGGVHVASKPGEGATFTVSMQLQQSHRSTQDVDEGRVPQVELNSLKVLVAEDNPINQIVIEEQLTSLGIQPTIVGNGEEALTEAIQKEADCALFDIIILDCQMPVMDGYEAARQIRANTGSIQNTPIIALTAHAMAGEREKCLNAGMNDFLTKPIGIKELKSCLSCHIPDKMEHQGAGI